MRMTPGRKRRYLLTRLVFRCKNTAAERTPGIRLELVRKRCGSWRRNAFSARPMDYGVDDGRQEQRGHSQTREKRCRDEWWWLPSITTRKGELLMRFQDKAPGVCVPRETPPKSFRQSVYSWLDLTPLTRIFQVVYNSSIQSFMK